MTASHACRRSGNRRSSRADVSKTALKAVDTASSEPRPIGLIVTGASPPTTSGGRGAVMTLREVEARLDFSLAWPLPCLAELREGENGTLRSMWPVATP
jgi:hypothetical protein